MEEQLNWLISVDDHLVEPAHLWQTWLPQEYKDRGPRLTRKEDGADYWEFEGTSYPTYGLNAVDLRGEFSPGPVSYDILRPGAYDPVPRIEDMNRDGVLASLIFPSTFPRFCGQTFSEAKDKDLGLACLRAYNDWMIDEWCASAPGRFIPMILIPLFDGRLAREEVLRCAGKGAKAVAFSENTSALGFPSIHDKDGYWDPFLDAVNETGMPICMHIGSSSKLPTTSPDAPMIITVALTPLNAFYTACDWLFSGLFTRFPNVKICLSEGGIGWVPYLLERLDYTMKRHGSWASKSDFKIDFSSGQSEASAGGTVVNTDYLPSELFRDHVFGCFISGEQHGIKSIDEIGVDNIMIETDFPHSDSSWPNSIELAHESLRKLSKEDTYKILQGNARRVFDFEPALPPVLSAPKHG
jgi:predicted TIM-barrel fold metal-dependent hydrolase